MLSDPITLYKLMILYMLDHVNFQLTNSQLTDFFLDHEYTTYFTLLQALNKPGLHRSLRSPGGKIHPHRLRSLRPRQRPGRDDGQPLEGAEPGDLLLCDENADEGMIFKSGISTDHVLWQCRFFVYILLFLFLPCVFRFLRSLFRSPFRGFLRLDLLLGGQKIFSGSHLVDERPDILSSLLGLSGERDQDILFLHSETGPDEFYLFLDLAPLDLVKLRRNDDRAEAVVNDPVVHSLIVGRRLMTDVHEKEDAF